MSRRADRWALAAGFAVAIGYAVVALVEALTSSHAAVALPFAYVAVSIAGPLGAMTWLLRDRQQGHGEDEPDGGDGPGPSHGGDDPPPPWWPDFERQFRAHVRREAGRDRTHDPV